ncbi:RagB/SusD family nutrient uptake outer membrane protein [Sphingobacterium faecium]|uniref:RagB/SusD family nutrient uptake outer membrane protein n=1 Tax=Sphingobacterium faecium TaxID=34087 RepID=UPI0024688A05|nr:RagB/SusD family nutrient uptake outer membrane protein [Sphingobacterium faecium]MDH5825851.1 RagB/SusD family nutrient uptake outer membrane protein [Sphingobacterium faecium]
MNRYLLLTILSQVLFLTSCNEFLEKKPDIKMVVPKSIEDATLLLNDYVIMNTGYPLWGEVGIDDYYVTKEKWESTSSLDQRNAYIWADEPYNDVVQWQRPYKAVYYANQVLEILAQVDKNADFVSYNRNVGAAHFFRAFAFQVLTEVHCPAYVASTAANELGIPLRLDPGIDEISSRANLQDTYVQIIADFKAAVRHLPPSEAVRGRPSKSTAYAGLARTYLNMADFEQAYLYADSCLQLNPELLDYNTLKTTDALPIPKFNVEVLFSAMSANLGIMGATSALMDDELYQSYEPKDLRKGIFFKPNANPVNTFYFKGSYDQSSAQLFMGITTSELYLVKAEAAYRIGKLAEARSVLNTLLKNRWESGSYVNTTETSQAALLSMILDERRKELVFRGRRWADLKRLNLEDRFKKTIQRQVGGANYMLLPNDYKYAYRLSETLTRVAGVPQNKR